MDFRELVYLVGFIVVTVVITVVPVMLAAKWARARNSGFLASLAAVVLAAVASQLSLLVAGDALLGTVLALVVAFAVFALVLRTSFVAAVGIAVVAVVLQLLIASGLAMLGVELATPLVI